MLWTSRKGSKEGWGWSFASPGAPPRSGALPPSQEDATVLKTSRHNFQLKTIQTRAKAESQHQEYTFFL